MKILYLTKLILKHYTAFDYSGIKLETYINASIECVQHADSNSMALIIADGLKANLT